MDLKEKIKIYFAAGLWTLDMVKAAVKAQRITEAEYLEITGQKYAV